MEKILVTGANGLLGQHLVQLLLLENYNVVGTGKGPSRLPFNAHERFVYYDADITNDFSFHLVMEKEKPSVVVHAAAMTQVDECQLKQDLCEEVNVKGTANVLMAAEEFSEFIIYLSTDFVFDGEKGNYAERDHQNPISWYGFTKVQAESLVESSDMKWAIVRTCLVYGNSLSGTRSNIITWVKQSLEEEKNIKVVNDQVRTPTYVEDLAKGILLIIQKRAEGIFHISGKDAMTPYDMAIATAGLFQLDSSNIEKVDASTFSQPAKRPPMTGFDITKARTELGYEPLSFAEGLKKMYSKD